MKAVVPWLALLLVSCDLTPRYVESSDIDDAMVRGQFKTVCVGLSMKNDDVRRYATARLQDAEDPIALECVCAHVERDGRWDEAVADGLKGSKRDDMVACLANLLDKPDQVDREQLVTAVARTSAPIAKVKLAEVAAAPGDAASRARATKAIAGAKEPEQLALLLKLMKDDTSPEVRAAAASSLMGQKDPAVESALRAAFQSDDDGGVRLEAMRTLNKLNVSDRDEIICNAMLQDAAPDVRKAAVAMYKGTKRTDAIACLRKRAFTEEEDASVREELLAVLKSSPKQEAADILCEAIPFWLKTYATTAIPEKIPGTNIVKAQNDRDWQNSYSCFAKAYAKRSSYSCYGSQHIAFWYREVGGNSFIPTCPGDKPPGSAGGGEVSGSGVSISGAP